MTLNLNGVTVDITTVTIVGGGIVSFLKLGLSIRDLIRDSLKMQNNMMAVMEKHGMDIEELQSNVSKQEGRLDRHEYMLQGLKLLLLAVVLALSAACAGGSPRPPVVVPQPPPVEAEKPSEPPTAPSQPAGESGWLRVENTRFYDDRGEWAWVGNTDFQLLHKYCETTQHNNPMIDLDGYLDQRKGFKVLRVFGMTAYLFRFVPTEYDYWTCVDRFADHLARRGFRFEYVVFADAQVLMPDVNVQRAHFQGAVETLSRHWNAIGELCNECAKNGVRPEDFNKPQGVRTLWSRGSGLADEAPPGPYWDFAGWHGRRDWPKVLASNEDMVYVQWGVGVDGGRAGGPPTAMVADEPIGVDESDQPGRRTNNCQIIEVLARSSRAFGRGMTYHSEAGLFSRPFGPRQAECAAIFQESMK